MFIALLIIAPFLEIEDLWRNSIGKLENFYIKLEWITHQVSGPQGFIEFFKMEENLLFCDNIDGLITAMGTSYTPSQWRLFLDSSKRSLNCVLLYNGNKLASIPIGHSVQMKETYENMKYENHF